METYNIASAFFEVANSQPDKLAIAIPEKNSLDKNGITRYKKISFGELAFETACAANGLLAAGFERGDKVVMMVPQGLNFFTLSFSMLQTGIVPVFVDPGIGIKKLKTCINEAEPEGFIAISKAHIARIFFGWGKKTIHKTVTIGTRLFWNGKKLKSIRNAKSTLNQKFFFNAEADDIAAIIFTSGSTGLPKGVVYTHGNFYAQLKMIRDTFNFSAGEIDMPTFAPYALFNAALGVSSILPDMNPAKPAFVNPLNIINPIKQFNITSMFGSPALIDVVGRYGESEGIKLPSLKRIISSGAPVPAKALKRFSSMLNSEAKIFTPYGATECMPVTNIEHHQILNTTQEQTNNGCGICVGKNVNDVEVAIIHISDDEIPNWSEDLKIAKGEIGEIVVKGKNVTTEYYHRESATRLAKIKDGIQVRHRTGDLGYFDVEYNLWFCGRKNHRVKTKEKELYSIQCEYIFNKHPDVFRTALIEVNNKAVLCVEIERKKKHVDKSKLKNELLNIAVSHRLTSDIDTVLFHPHFPVDIRHNAKIIREKLVVWAKNKLA